MNQLKCLVWLTGIFSMVFAAGARAEMQPSPVASEEATTAQHLHDIESPATTVGEWLAQIEAAIVEITGVRVESSETGLQVILETADGDLSVPTTETVGNALVAEIPNAVLALPEGDEFQATDPAAGIARVSVTAVGQDRIQVAITGTDAPPEATVNAEAGNLVWTVVPGIAQVDDADDAIEIVVTGEQDTGYRVERATTATRTDTPIRDIPQSIQVVPRQVLEDQQVIRLREALRNVSGVIQGNTTGNTVPSFIIRGFEQLNVGTDGSGTIYRDGFRENFEALRDTANIEQIEVLKGPASILFGNLEPGGIINLVTERPLATPSYEAQLQVGSFGFVRPTIDLTGPLNSDRSLLYRFNAAYEREDGFRNFDQDVNHVFVAPEITWQISDHTDIAIELEYLYDERPFDRGVVAIGNEVADIPFDRVLGELDDKERREILSTGYRLEHQFNDNLRLRNAFRFNTTLNGNNNSVQNLAVDEVTGELSRIFVDVEDDQSSYALYTNLVGEFTTGPIAHTLLFGIDLERIIDIADVRFGAAPSINIFDPVYGQVPRPERDELQNVSLRDSTIDTLGIYLQDQVTIRPDLKLLIGGRFDLYHREQTRSFNGNESSVEQDDQAFSPRVGVVYQPIEPLSLYASFTRSFAPNTGTAFDGSILDPTRGTQYEIGLRGEFFEDRLTANLAAFHLTRTNVATADPDNPNFSIAVGEQRSQGIELDVAGEILPGWNIIASYAYTDAEITDDNTFPEGNSLFGVPKNAASLWTTYELQRGDLQGLGFGLGLFFVGERPGDLANSFEVDSYIRTDASVFYQRDNWRAGINIQNLFDIDYIESASRRTRINPGIPFTVLGTVSIEF
ncbi:TonB-dependent siderophore receptor [Halomicronema hongdechloris C2206]|uniref:TonB-dependent siderophore receptor n=1 Tax=Halomicronema hongdechloris C2206 TaxID=1641165 RepID=A0A1Z3HL47_9CYAN|nr:TonB-dependent receptor [Halomicronema hongdechloris]ASC71018.1 TonB-dependent siderophore receptor [Halomicronema hongdechloris C2206]